MEPEEDDDIYVAFFGKTGAGKSQIIRDWTGNELILVRPRTSWKSCTLECQVYEDAGFGVLMDTVGILDTNYKETHPDEFAALRDRVMGPEQAVRLITSRLIREAIEFLQRESPHGLNMVVLVIKYDTFTESEQSVIELLLGMLKEEEEIWKHIAIAITGCEDLNDPECEQLVKSLGNDFPIMGELIERIQGRVCCLGHNAHRQETEKERETRDRRLNALKQMVRSQPKKIKSIFDMDKVRKQEEELDDLVGSPEANAISLKDLRGLDQQRLDANRREVERRIPELAGKTWEPHPKGLDSTGGQSVELKPGLFNRAKSKAKECCKV